MRHEQILERDSYRKVDIAAVRPATSLVSPAPIPESFEAQALVAGPTPAAPDVPAGAWIALAGSYFALVGTFALAAVGSGLSLFVVTIAILFVATFFTVPRLMFGMEPRNFVPPAFEAFLAEGMDTLNGRCSGGAALLQMLIVPVLLTFGAAGMAIAAAIYF